MAFGSTFITRLRDDWNLQFGDHLPFEFLTVAGASDQFVPPESSLGPFARRLQRVVAGDHVTIVKPANSDAPSLNLVVNMLQTGTAPVLDTSGQLRLAAESVNEDAPQLVQAVETRARLFSAREIVDAALALERAGDRAQSGAFLERHKDKDTDVKGTLGGRFKRLWFLTEQSEYADRALQLYREALDSALAANEPDQIYYLAINVAFMRFVYSNDLTATRSFAEVAMKYADPPGNDVWKTATVAEANLYFGRIENALAGYRRLLMLQTEDWKHCTTALQASRIAAKLGNRSLVGDLEAIFTPGGTDRVKSLSAYDQA
jgi:hypothetical protein